MEGLEDSNSSSLNSNGNAQTIKEEEEEQKQEAQKRADSADPKQSKSEDIKEETESVDSFDPKTSELSEPHRFAPKDLLSLLRNIERSIHHCEGSVRDENEKRRKHRVDDCRRVHNYDEFITTFLAMLTERGMLGDLLEYGLNPKKKEATVAAAAAGGAEAKVKKKANNGAKVVKRGAVHRRGRPKKRK